MTTYRLDLPWPAPPLNLNDRVHRAVKASAVAEVRRSVGWLAKAAQLGSHDRVRVTLNYRPAVNRARDDDNLVATAKPCFDGLVDAKLVIGDTPRHMKKLMPVIHEPGQPSGLWLDIEVLDGPAIDWKSVAVRVARRPGADLIELSDREADALRTAIDDHGWIAADKLAEIAADAATYHEGA